MNDHNHYIKPISTWLWIFALVSVGFFGGLLYYLDQYEKGNLQPDEGINIKELFAGNQSSSKTTGEAGADTGKKKPSFEFYSLLRDLEVVVPESEIPTEAIDDQKPNISDQDTSQPENPPLLAIKKTPAENLPIREPKFFIQAGSFKDFATADKMKANLALLGIVAKIESVKIPESGTWHRVRVGPFENKRQISKVRRVLKTNRIDSITVKIKG